MRVLDTRTIVAVGDKDQGKEGRESGNVAAGLSDYLRSRRHGSPEGFTQLGRRVWGTWNSQDVMPQNLRRSAPQNHS